MTLQRRVFNSLPNYLKTDQNRRDMYISDDVLYEPEQSAFLNGYIGDTSILAPEDLLRTPAIREANAERQKYQLSIGAAYVDPTTLAYVSGAFYTDLVEQLRANGALLDDPNRVFDANFYAWTPPIDYDKHINYARYVWTGFGSDLAGGASTYGEFITKEPAGSQTVIFRFNGTDFVKLPVKIVSGLPLTGTIGDIVEDASTGNRLFYEWTGVHWTPILFTVTGDVPTDLNDFKNGDFVYVARTGLAWNRSIIWVYKTEAGRWISIPVRIGPNQPDVPRIGMIWEDATVIPNRVFRIWDGALWQKIIMTSGTPNGKPANNTYLYDIRDISTVDAWSANNWWRYFEDLSPVDRSIVIPTNSAIRPIVEFWGNLECTNTRQKRNDFPIYRIYTNNTNGPRQDPDMVPIERDIDSLIATSTIFQYQLGSTTSQPDKILGFPVILSSTGEYLFDLTLESQTVPNGLGYRYFKDTSTSYIHRVWAKSDIPLSQAVDSNGLYEVPKNITSNSDHSALTSTSRSDFVLHMTSVIAAQKNFQGDPFGLNNYRFTDKNPTIGSTILDHEGSLLRALALLQNRAIDLPDTIRQIAHEYNKVLGKFINRMNMLWAAGTINTISNTLPPTITASQAVDIVLSGIFLGKTASDFPFYSSDMGTYLYSRVNFNIVTVLDPTPFPILLPNSPARIGVVPTWTPQRFIDNDGIWKIRCHDGAILTAFNDDRDLIVLELENRFFGTVPSDRKTETTTFSSRYNTATFHLDDFYGNFLATTTQTSVNEIVDNYTLLLNPAVNLRVYSRAQEVFAVYDGSRWLLTNTLEGDVFLNSQDGKYYISTGFYVEQIPIWPKLFSFQYYDNEYRRIIRRDFERFANTNNLDFVTNTTFNQNDPFTWNYASAGIEGNYRGIYRRVYGTFRPHSHPWEIAGYTVEPDWWTTSWIPTSFFSDGTPRYASSHPMWTALKAGHVNPNGLIRLDRAFTAPIPVDIHGNLIDPIQSGLITEQQLDTIRIRDDWVYGDGAPGEETFYESRFYSFAIAMAGYLMKPAQFIDRLWADLYINVGEDEPNYLWRAPHLVWEPTLTRPPISGADSNILNAPDVNIGNQGLNSWIHERVMINGGSPSIDFHQVLDNTFPTLGWKTAGFINKNRTIIETLSSMEVPFEDVHVVLHQDPAVTEVFQSGLIVVRQRNGYKIFGYDTFNPYFRTELGAIPIVGGEIELREEFVATTNQHDFIVDEFNIPQNVNDTATLSILINGFKLKPQHYTVTDRNRFSIERIVTINAGDVITVVVITVQSNPSSQIKTFVVDGVTFGYFGVGTGQFVNYEYGHFFPSASDVVNFMVGHGRYLVSQGWQFTNLSDTSTEIFDWLSGAKLFAKWALDTAVLANRIGDAVVGETFLFTAMGDLATLKTAFGFPLGVENIRNGAYGIVDHNGVPIPTDQTLVSREEDTLTVQIKNPGTQKIYGVRVYLTALQHVVFFSNVTKFNDLLYDPVIASWQKAFLADTYRSANWNGRLEAPGNIVFNDRLLPNFEKQTFDITRYYSRLNPPDDPVKRDQARNLYGYVPGKSYMMDVDAEDRTQFDFYLGMIHAKGTRRVFEAFARGTRMGSDNMLITEDWAWRLAPFGDLRSERVQFSVSKVDFHQQLQIVEFTDTTSNPNEYVLIPSFDRNDLPNPRWVIPPRASALGIANFTFPVDEMGLPDRTYSYSCRLYDTIKDIPILIHSHWDPQIGVYEPLAFSQVNFRNPYDPARYNEGSDVTTEVWGADHVGEFWWDTSRTVYYNYRRDVPNYTRAAHQWGKLLYYNASITRTNEIVTVTTLDVNTNLPTRHHLVTGQLVSITDANQTDYNLTDIAVTVSSSTTFTFEINAIPDSPATGNIKVVLGDIAVYEWVSSPVRPDQWSNYIATLTGPDVLTGTVLNTTNWSQETIIDQYGNSNPVYYFWVRSNKLINEKKTLSVFDVEGRLRDPITYGIPLFAPIDASTMMIFTNGDQVEDGYVIDLVVDHREMETHDEWALISEGDDFTPIPTRINTKIIDSMCGIDEFGNPVPNQLLSSKEKFGSGIFPAQTIFPDQASAVRVYLAAVNGILKAKNQEVLTPLVKMLSLTTEKTTTNPDGYWTRASYIKASLVSRPIFDVTVNLAERDRRTGLKFYANGDIIHVEITSEIDLWTGLPTGAYYEYENGSWVLVGVDNHTVLLDSNVTLNQALFRTVYAWINENFRTSEQNSLVFSMLYEMSRQNPICDWLIKTSYIRYHMTVPLYKLPYKRTFDPDTVLSAILDLKPYRTKIRKQTVSFPYEEDMTVNIADILVPKITILFDRLSCNLLDDHTWDSDPWDDVPWDLPLWALDDLGRKYFTQVGSITCDSLLTSYTLPVTQTSFLYGVNVVILRNGVPVDLSPDLSVTVSRMPTRIIIDLSQALPPQYTIEVFLAQGFYDSTTPTLGHRIAADFPSLVVTPSTYKHAAARLQFTSASSTLMAGCSGDLCGSRLGGNSEERVVFDVEDSLNIRVTTSNTPAYAGWDTTPWDSTGWDQKTVEAGSHSYFILAGNEVKIPPGIEIFPTSELALMGTRPYVYASSPHYLVGWVYWDTGTGMELRTQGVDWDYLAPFTHIIQILVPLHLNIQIQLVYKGFDLRAHRGLVVSSYPTLYDIVGNHLIFSAMPVLNRSVTVNFTQSRIRPQPLARLVDGAIEVDDMYVSHTQYDPGSGPSHGFETSRPVGFKVVDQTNNHYWTWSGTTWTDGGAVANNQRLFVRELQSIYLFSAGVFSLLWTVGGTYSSATAPLLLNDPKFGEGLTWGTYSLGQLPDARTNWPDAYQVMRRAS